jgi:hypothetical protein
MPLSGDAKKEYNKNYRQAQKEARLAGVVPAQPAPEPAVKQRKAPRPSMPLVEAYPRISPVQAKKVFEQLNVDDPVIAERIAETLYKQNFNYRAAAREIAPNNTAVDQMALAQYWRTHPAIEAAVQKKLASIGLDEDAEAHLVAALWYDVYNGSPREKANAQKLLALKLGWGARSASNNQKPAELPITDYKKGLDDMGLGDEVMNDTPAGEFTDNLQLLEQDEEDEDDSEVK